MPDPTPKPTAEEMAHAVCENQWGQEGVVKSERDSAAKVLLPLITRRDDQIRRKAFEEAAERLDLEAVRFERKKFSSAESRAYEYRRAATLIRALAKEQAK